MDCWRLALLCRNRASDIASLHSAPSLPLAKDSERAPFQVEPIGADERYHARICFPTLGIEQAALPLVVARFDRAADNDSADIRAARPLAGDLAAELAAAIIESDLGPVRWSHPL